MTGRPGRVVAGVDVGNASTEVVLARSYAGSPEALSVIGAGRVPTRGAKGSPESLDGAAALVRRIEREHGVRTDVAVAARLRPVETRTVLLPAPAPDTGRLRVAGAGARTAGRPGFAVGRPHRLGSAPPAGGEPVVAVAAPGSGYRSVVAGLAELAAGGVRVVAVVMGDDEGVLVGNRWPGTGPVVDEVDTAVLGTDRVAVEVAGPGAPLRQLTDPLRLVEVLGLGPGDRPAAARLALALADRSNAVVAVSPVGAAVPPRAGPAGWIEAGGLRRPFPAAHAELRRHPVGWADGLALPGPPGPAGVVGADAARRSVDDVWSVDLAAVAAEVVARAGTVEVGAAVLASLRSGSAFDPAAALTERLGVPVEVGDEVRAGRVGALSTPGAGDGSGVVVVDLGGGTVDVSAGPSTPGAVGATGAVVAAGAGELLTAAVARLTGASRAAAEHVKRGPARQVHAPQVLVSEDGERTFADRPVPATAVGGLVVTGPAGLLPFGRGLGAGEWRALRLRLKVEVLGANVARALRTLDVRPATVVVVGGPAEDDEVLSVIARSLPAGVAVARGRVAGILGPRYAVAHGLARDL